MSQIDPGFCQCMLIAEVWKLLDLLKLFQKYHINCFILYLHKKSEVNYRVSTGVRILGAVSLGTHCTHLRIHTKYKQAKTASSRKVSKTISFCTHGNMNSANRDCCKFSYISSVH